jgi:hypothetical protein
VEGKDRKKVLDAVEALLKDMEREMVERGELTDEDKAAIERLRRLCGEGEDLLAREED